MSPNEQMGLCMADISDREQSGDYKNLPFFSCSTLLWFVKKMKVAAVWILAIWWECTP